MYYYVSTGYRRTADNICDGGVEHPKARLSCPGGWGFIGLALNFLFRLVFYGAVIFVVFIGGRYFFDKYADYDFFDIFRGGGQNGFGGSQSSY